ncbi:MAG: hypothetical protein FWG28_01270 [Clostridiales bacterium]|nr:hypothetical protein [Clostridiales bacterium]
MTETDAINYVDTDARPVLFVAFPRDSPVIQLLTQRYRVEGILPGILEAAEYLTGAKGSGGDAPAGAGEPAIALVNCLDYYRNISVLQKDPDGELIRQLGLLKEARDDLEVRLLMPEGKNTDQDILVELMSRGFYDFWFLTALRRPLLLEILETKRDFREIEAYLSRLPPPAPRGEGGQAVGKWMEKYLPSLKPELYLPLLKKAAPALPGSLRGLLAGAGIGAAVEGGRGRRRGSMPPDTGWTDDGAPDAGRAGAGYAGEGVPEAGWAGVRFTGEGMPDGETEPWSDYASGAETQSGYAGRANGAADADYGVDFYAPVRNLAGKADKLRQRIKGIKPIKPQPAEALLMAEGPPEEGKPHSEEGASGVTGVAEASGEGASLSEEGASGVAEASGEGISLVAEKPSAAGRKAKAEKRLKAERAAKPAKRRSGKALGKLRSLTGGKRRRLPPGAGALGDSVLFYSEEDCLMPYALAFMTAAYFAGRGGKTLLVELPGSGSRLAVALGLRHPEKNISGALRGYGSGERGDWGKYCFNGLELFNDPKAYDQSGYSKRLPRSLYFLPDDHAEEALYPHCDGFLASLVHWAIMEAKFTSIVYVGFGSREGLCWKKGLVCSRKVIAFPPWPGGFNEVPRLENDWHKGCLPAFDGSWGVSYIRKEVKSLRLKEYLIVPGALKEDFIQMAAFERGNGDYSPESLQCLEALWG